MNDAIGKADAAHWLTRQSRHLQIARRRAFGKLERLRWVWVVALMLTAFGLRMVDLESRSLWLDEGFSLLRIQSDWQTLLANTVDRQGFQTTDVHPPLYFALVKVWAALAGSHVFTWRLFSAFCSTLLVPASIVLAQRVGGKRAAGVAGVLAAASPVYLWYAAEVRMYALVALLGCIGTYFVLRALTRPHTSGKTMLSWLLISIAASFTHYSLLIAVAIQSVFVLKPFWQTAYQALRRPLVWLFLATAVVIGAVASLLVAQPTLQVIGALFNQAVTAPAGQGTDPVWFAYEIGSAIAFGLNAGDPTNGVLVWLFWVVVFLGVAWFRREEFLKQAFLSSMLVLSFSAWLVLAHFIENSPSFRYVAFIFPVAHALIGRSVALLSQRALLGKAVATAVAVFVVGTNLFGARMTLTPSPTWQDDWRGMAEYLRQHLRPSDGILLGVHASEFSLSYYLGWPVDRFESVGNWHTLPLTEAQAMLKRAYPRLWVVLAGSEEDFWNRFALSLVEPYTLVREVPFPARTTALKALLYDATEAVEAQQPMGTTSDPQSSCSAHLCIAAFNLTSPSSNYNRPGFGLEVHWIRGQALQAKEQAFTPPKHLSVRLEHSGETWLDFQLDAGLEGVNVEDLGGKAYLAFYNVPLWAGLPPLPYQLTLSLIGADGQPLGRVTTELGIPVVLTYLRITHLDVSPFWRGREVEIVTSEVPNKIQQGNDLPVALTWRTNRASTPPWLTRLTLLDEQSRTSASVERDMRAAAWPVSQWPAGELVRDQYSLPTSELPPGTYRLVLQREWDGRLLNEVALAAIEIIEPPLEPVETRFDRAIGAEVGALTLLGYSIEKPADDKARMIVRTFWRANQTPKADGRLFVHLLDARGNPVAQDDGAPFNGARTTPSLRPGEGVRQTHVLRLPTELSSGRYLLFAGIYNSADLERWPVTQDGKPGLNNLVSLGEITLP